MALDVLCKPNMTGRRELSLLQVCSLHGGTPYRNGVTDLDAPHLRQNFGMSFTIISVITGIPSLFLYGLVRGCLSSTNL